MSLKKFKPTTPGQRHKVISDYSEVTTSKPEKSLTKGVNKSGGRNNTGKMTMRYIGGGHKRKYRVIDFKSNKFVCASFNSDICPLVSITYSPYACHGLFD